jgi:hypothetical protein
MTSCSWHHLCCVISVETYYLVQRVLIAVHRQRWLKISTAVHTHTQVEEKRWKGNIIHKIESIIPLWGRGHCSVV